MNLDGPDGKAENNIRHNRRLQLFSARTSHVVANSRHPEPDNTQHKTSSCEEFRKNRQHRSCECLIWQQRHFVVPFFCALDGRASKMGLTVSRQDTVSSTDVRQMNSETHEAEAGPL